MGFDATSLPGDLSAVALAAVFATAGVSKLRDRQATASGVVDLGIPPVAAGFVTRLLPITELLAAAMLLPRPTRTFGAGLALGLLTCFSVLLAIQLRRGRRPRCHCFGRSNRPTGPEGLIRNAALGGLAMIALLR